MKPYLCNYYVTYRCNSMCEFCRIWQDKDLAPVDETPLDKIKANLESLKKLGVTTVEFTGGEPLLREDLPQILKTSKDLEFYNNLTTNCILFPDMAKDIIPHVDRLLFSLDAPEEDEHDRIRGTACFEKVIESIEIAKRFNKKPIINFTATRQSINFLPEMVEIAEKHGLLLWINPVYDFSGLQGFTPETIDHIKYMLRRESVAANLAALEFVRRGGNDIIKPRCRALHAVVTISPNGKLLLPCFHLREKEVKIEESLDSLYHSDVVKDEIRSQGKYVKCSGCMAWEYIIPSFNYKIDRYFFLNLYSLFLETRKRRRLDAVA